MEKIETLEKIEALKKIVRDRFIHRPYGYIMDYAKPSHNEDILPTSEECQSGIPNVLGWGTPCEDGAFFTGLYLYALCREYDQTSSQAQKDEIIGFCKALFLLCDVCEKDGCIARGVAEDGHSHYAFSSEDQVCPFVIGLWRAMHSLATDDSMKSEIRQRLIRTISGLKNAGWKVPTELDGVTRGIYCKDDWRGAAKMIFCAKVGQELGIIDESEFENIRNEHPCNSIFKRYEIVSHGFSPDMIRNTALIQFWIDVCANLCTYEMVTLDEAYAKYYRQGLESNGYAVLNFLNDYRQYDNESTDEFSYDWRMVSPLSKKCTDVDEAMAVAGRTHGAFISQNPRRRMEHDVTGQMLFALWIALVSPNVATVQYATQKLYETVEYIDFTTFCYSYAFLGAGAFCLLNSKVDSKSDTFTASSNK